MIGSHVVHDGHVQSGEAGPGPTILTWIEPGPCFTTTVVTPSSRWVDMAEGLLVPTCVRANCFRTTRSQDIVLELRNPFRRIREFFRKPAMVGTPPSERPMRRESCCTPAILQNNMPSR